MIRHSAAQVLAAVTSALVQDHDVTDIMSTLLTDASDLLGADAAGLLVKTRGGQLELLSATSHHVAVLEIFQARQADGPCVDCIRSGETVHAVGADAIRSRWPTIGPVIVQAGFQTVHAQPLQWHDTVLGGMNFFRSTAEPLNDNEAELAEAVTNAAMLALTQTPGLDLADVTTRIQSALHGRIVIEQAKGVIAHRQRLDMAAAYQHLVHRAQQDGTPLTATAEEVINKAAGAQSS